MGLESLQKNDTHRGSRPKDDEIADRLREAPPKSPEFKLNDQRPTDQRPDDLKPSDIKPNDQKAKDQKPAASTDEKLNDKPYSSFTDQQAAGDKDTKVVERNGAVIERRADNTARAKDVNNVWHEGKMIGDTFIGQDDHKNTDLIIRPDGSQSLGTYNYDQAVAGQKPPLKSLTEISAKGERRDFTQDPNYRNRLIRVNDGRLQEERFHTNLDGRGAAYWDDKDKAGVSTIVLGDSTVEHGNIIFGDASQALAFRNQRKALSEDKHIHPMTSPTFCLDNQGRVSAILAPEKGGTEGCNDSAAGGSDRFFTYMGDSKKLANIGEMANKGVYADVMYHTTRQGDSDKWTVQMQSIEEKKVLTYKKDDNGKLVVENGHYVYDRDEDGHYITKTESGPRQPPFTFEYQGAMGFEPGTLDLVWQQKLNPSNKADLRKYAVVNHPDGSVDRVYNSYQTDNGRADGNILYHLDKYLNKDLDLNHPIGIQHRDARNNKLGQPYKLGRIAGLDLLPDGNVKFTDRQGNRHRIGPDHRETVLNPSDQTYLKKDTAGQVIESGPVIVTNPAASFADRAYQIDERNHTQYRYSTEDNTIQITRTIDGVAQEPTSLQGLMYPNGELWHHGPDGATLVERPDFSTTTIHPKGSGKQTEHTYSNNEIKSVRHVPEGPNELDFVLDTLHHKASGQEIDTRLRAMTPEQAAKLGLTAPFTHYYLTRTQITRGGKDGKEEKAEWLIPPPNFDDMSQTPQRVAERQRELQMVFVNPEALANGSIQATTLNGDQVRFNLPKTPQDLFQPTIIDTATHLAQSQEKFESLVIQHRQEFEALVRQNLTIASGPLVSTSDPNWIDKWAFSQFHIQLAPPGQPTTAAQAEEMARHRAFSYDAGIATILASKNRTPRTAMPFSQPAGQPGSSKPAGWNDVFKQLEERKPAKTPSPPQPGKPPATTDNSQSSKDWDSAARGLGLFFRGLLGR